MTYSLADLRAMVGELLRDPTLPDARRRELIRLAAQLDARRYPDSDTIQAVANDYSFHVMRPKAQERNP